MTQNLNTLKNNTIHSENYRKFGISIVIRAIQDYKKCYYMRNSSEKKSLERFFKSQWCYYLISSCCDMEMEIESVLPTIQKYIERKSNVKLE